VPLGEQSLSVPLHKLLVSFDHQPVGEGFAYDAGLQYEGDYNELNLSPYATLRAGVTYHTRHFDIGLYGTNLTNVYDSSWPKSTVKSFTVGCRPGGSRRQRARADHRVSTAGRQVTLTLTHHM
jgi:hypothetical protein